MSRTKHYDAIVIGTGPGGEGAAMKLAKAGKAVAVIESHSEVGGGCTHWGTIPSKALRHNVRRMMEFNTNPLFREVSEPRHLSFPQVMRSAQSVIDKQVALRTGFYTRNDVPIFPGKARFADAHTLELEGPQGRISRFSADYFVIATGSCPYNPSDLDFTHARVFDSDTILSLDHTPRTITIYGAGVIGSEYASIFRYIPRSRGQGGFGQHPGANAGLSRRRDLRRPFLPPARARRADPPSRGIRSRGVK